MQNEKDTTKSNRGSLPQPNAEEIYSDWLKRPKSIGTSTPGSKPNESHNPDQIKETE